MMAATMVDSCSEKTRLSVSETIQEIKDAVGNHTEEDILIVLKETNMDANEAVHKLLYQDSFHEVKRKRDKKKEIPVIKRSSEPRKFAEPNTGIKGSSEPRKVIEQNTAFKRSSEPSKPTEQTHGLRPRTFSERNVRRQGYSRGSFPDAGTSRQFRVVRDNRVNQNTNREAAVQSTTSASGQGTPAIPPRSQVRILTDQRHIGPRNSEGQRSSQTGNGPSDSGRGQYKDTNSSSNNRKGVSDENRAKAPTASASQGPRPRSSNSASNNTVVGLYSSSSDPVHVPSNSRPSGNRHAVGVVGYPRKSSDNSKQHSTVPSSSTKETSSVSQPPPPSGSTTIKSNHHAHPPTSDSAVTNTKSFTNKPHQPPTGHQKAPHGNRKWKPKPSSIGTSTTMSVPPPVDHSVEKEAEHLENQMSQVSIDENEHVFIPQHLRVPEADRTHLTFGSFGIVDINSSNLENEPQSSEEDVINQVDSLNGQSGNSESASPASENPSADVKESSSPNLEAYADMGIVRNNSPPYAPAQPQQQQQQQQDAPLPSYVTYDSQPGYDMPFYRPMTDESLRTHQSVPSPVEALSSHVPNSIPPSSLAIPQLYPQVHVSHFPGYMPYRQFIPSMYVPPPMGVPGYTSNPGYPHPQNGGGYMLMPGGSSHMSAAAAASGLKYGPASQYKPIPAGTPTGFGNYPSPTGYAINTQGAPIGGANGLDDSTRMKFKDGNLYVPNPQAETSEIWIQTPREIPGMQSAPYYNIPGQAPHPAAYMTSHPGHASFNGAAAVQPTHMQYPGLYHPSPQQAGMANQHHMVQNVGVAGAAPGGAQIGAYQQPQLGHLNWNTNF